ncbi:MAG: hypothetical protein JSW41_00085 [Candidatus Aenigmatarchaeota archaeon]|nr:MAG: hypothetical protein JSW41_00085 [Candidatus Aenigmarchaeota archaeon]
MECPKCGGGAYLTDEELIKVLENTDPIKIMFRAIFSCRACAEKFSRIFYDDLGARKKPPEVRPYPYQGQQGQQYEPVRTTDAKSEDEAAEGLKFF